MLSNSASKVEWPSQVMRKASFGGVLLIFGSTRGKTELRSFGESITVRSLVRMASQHKKSITWHLF